MNKEKVIEMWEKNLSEGIKRFKERDSADVWKYLGDVTIEITKLKNELKLIRRVIHADQVAIKELGADIKRLKNGKL